MTNPSINQIAKRDAVRVACKDAMSKGKLGIVAMLHGINEVSLRKFVKGDDLALTESQIDWLAVDLRNLT